MYVQYCQPRDAPTRMLIESTGYDEALEIAKNAAENISVDPQTDGTHIGPLYKIQYDRVQKDSGWLDEGEILLTGACRPRNFEKGWFVNPSFLGSLK